LRLSVGLADPQDLLDDLALALAGLEPGAARVFTVYMRQYAVILIAVVVLIAGFVARKYLAPGQTASTAVPAEVEAATRALNAADTLVLTLASGQYAVTELDPKVKGMRESCEQLEKLRPTAACAELRSKGDALQRAARNQTIGESAAQDFRAATATLRAELGR